MCEHGFYIEHDAGMAIRAADEASLMFIIRMASSQIMKPPIPEPKVGIKNTRKLFATMSTLFLIDFLVLTIELIYFKKSNPDRNGH